MPLDRDIATNLFAAISTDTGSFQYEQTSARTYEIGAALVRLGVPVGEISRDLYESYPAAAAGAFARAAQRPEADGGAAGGELRAVDAYGGDTGRDARGQRGADRLHPGGRHGAGGGVLRGDARRSGAREPALQNAADRREQDLPGVTAAGDISSRPGARIRGELGEVEARVLAHIHEGDRAGDADRMISSSGVNP